MTFWYGSDVNGWGYVLMIIGMVAFWGLLISGFMLLIRQPGGFGQPEGRDTAPRSPEQLLAERFARGEIDEPEYVGRLATLHGHVRA